MHLSFSHSRRLLSEFLGLFDFGTFIGVPLVGFSSPVLGLLHSGANTVLTFAQKHRRDNTREVNRR